MSSYCKSFMPALYSRLRFTRLMATASSTMMSGKIKHEQFFKRYIGPSKEEVGKMLRICGVQSMEELISKTIPSDIRVTKPLKKFEPLSEFDLAKRVEEIASKNEMYRSYIGQGYSNCNVPPVIKRNILENPGWITQYTPYQTELAQGRLESLMNFQTMVTDLTGLDVANASLLDEATSAAEAMSLCYQKFKKKRGKFFVDVNTHDHSLAVLKTRAKFLNVEIIVGDYQDFTFTDEYCGALIQYPNSVGNIVDYSQFISNANDFNIPVAMATDLLSLTLLKPPGELGASIAFGNAQRFGVPMGCGGPHAAFFAVKDNLKKLMPGRLVGKTWDYNGLPTYRLALQTREQFIRRGKSTSNICTAQALLANMSAMYAIYHGPKGLTDIAGRVHTLTLMLAEGLRRQGHTMDDNVVFDTVRVTPKGDREDILRRAEDKRINIRQLDDGSFGVSLDETVTIDDLKDLLYIFGNLQISDDYIQELLNISSQGSISNSKFARTSKFLEHPVFNSYHSETELTRYMKRLENLDLSLTHSMIPLGSCTMKLNPTSALLPISMPEFNSLHPFVPSDQTRGYQEMLEELEAHLCDITGYDKFSFQPNSGAQGEYAGLCAIMEYFKDRGETQKNICLIPDSAHGTNPASAVMAGLEVVEIPTKDGEISLDIIKAKIEQYSDRLAALMITYPSTSGVFDDTVKEICDMVHHYGGQVYVDGANLNAQVGLCRIADYGGDVSHLNLHKTFCIPHGGGGPGMGPIGVKSHLIPYLPRHPVTGVSPAKSFGTVSASEWGSASILPISWAYILMMGSEGLKKASERAILCANYMANRLKEHYQIMFQGSQGFNAHEFILDTRSFKVTTGIEAIDIAKRLQDYGFHAPTISWPVSNTMMIEPTECESKAELDRYCDALISIRKEIAEIEEGKYSRHNNVLKNAPHSLHVVTSSNWNYPYHRETAAFPASWLTPTTKLWPGGGRANDVHGDKNLVVTHYQNLLPLK